MEKVNFTSLTPESRKANEGIYTEVLDEALNNNSIKNIAITGVYGAGKSTIWETYKNEKNLRNVITVSLGKYDDEGLLSEVEKKQQNEGEDFKERLRSKKEEIENSIERQLINQVVAQIDSKSIPLSKYQYQENKSFLKSIFEVILSLSFILSILFWIYRKEFLLKIQNEIVEKGFLVLVLFLFLIPIAYVVFGLTKRKKLQFLKVKIGTTEASLQEDLNVDETVLDRDIRELVYVLYNSKSDLVVFEDLDRYDHLEIYKKLRELNFLVNSFITSKNDKRVVKFVYLLRDGLFYSKNRTKFFDFIIPVIPVIDSRNSENKLVELFEGSQNSPSKRTITNISLYIDDMRLLKNIYNEYNIYFNIIAMDHLQLTEDKLLSLIVLKNVFPKEFDALQQDRGDIYNLIQKKELFKKKLKSQKKEELSELNNRINLLNEAVAKSKYDLIAQYIPADVHLNQNGSEIWSEILKEWNQSPEEKKIVYYYNGGYNRSSTLIYEEFLKKHIYRNEEIKEEIQLYPSNKEQELKKLSEKKIEIKEYLKAIDLLNLSQILKKMSVKDREEAYDSINDALRSSHYFALVKYLFYEGLIDETYWHYKGYFYTNSIGKNDMLFLKNILEGNDQDVFLELENPKEVIDRLNDDDFLRNNILNSKVLQQCLLDDSSEKVSNMLTVIVQYNNIENLSNILDSYYDSDKIEFLNKFIEITFLNNAEMLFDTIKSIEKYNINLSRVLIVSLYSQEELTKDIENFRDIIESDSEVLLLVESDQHDAFFKNLSENKIEFLDLPTEAVSEEVLKEIIDKDLYTLNISNVHYLVSSNLNQEEVGSVLLSHIFREDNLVPIKRRIELNFDGIIEEYIDSYYDLGFFNSEDIVIKILNSGIDYSYKELYMEKNLSIITDLSLLQNIEAQIENRVLDKLFQTDKLEFSDSNILFYLENGGIITKEFLSYIEKNHQKNSNIVKKSKMLCNKLLRHAELSNDLFAEVLLTADEPLVTIRDVYSEDRLLKLVSKDLLDVNDDTINYLLENSYINSLVSLYNSSDIDITEIILSNSKGQVQLSPEQISTLINDVDAEDNIITLIEGLGVHVDVSQIDLSKREILSYLIENDLSDENIEYIMLNFENFSLKDQFINKLQENIDFNELEYSLLKDSFIRYALQSNSVSKENKLSLIESLIDNSENYQDFLEFLKMVKEIEELARVFDNGRPKIDTEAKERIASSILEKGYVKKWGVNRIMLDNKSSHDK